MKKLSVAGVLFLMAATPAFAQRGRMIRKKTVFR